jgi:hypothetical protein
MKSPALRIGVPAVCFMTFLAGCGARNPLTDSPEGRAVHAWLEKNLDDPNYQLVELKGPASSKDMQIIRIKIRAKNKNGAWEMQDLLAGISDGKVAIVLSHDAAIKARQNRVASKIEQAGREALREAEGLPPASGGITIRDRGGDFAEEALSIRELK